MSAIPPYLRYSLEKTRKEEGKKGDVILRVRAYLQSKAAKMVAPWVDSAVTQLLTLYVEYLPLR